MNTGTTVETIWSERSSLVWPPFRISSDPLTPPPGPGSATNSTSHTPSASSTPFLDFDALQVALTRLDHSPQKVKGAVGRSGALGSRRPPSRGSRRSSAESVASLHLEDEREEEGEQEKKDQQQHLNKEDDLVIPRVVDADVQSSSKDHSNKDYFSERNSELLSERSFVSDTRKSAYVRKAPSLSDNNRLRSLTDKLYSSGDQLNSSREILHSSGDKLNNTAARLNSSRESVPSPLLSRLFRESGTTFEKNKDNVNVPGNNKSNKKKLNCITQIYQPLVLQSEVVSLSSFSGLESASQIERRDSRSSSEADVVISDRESIADSGVVNRRTVIRINEKKSKSASSLVSKEEEEDVEPLWIRDLNSRRSLREEKKGVQRIIPIEIYPEVHGGINVSIVSQPDPYRKDSTSRMFVRQCDSENRPTRASAFNVRKTIEKRQIQQERRERKALREQLRQQLRSLSEGRQRKDSSSGSYVSSVLLSQNSLRSKSMSSLDQDTDDSRSESPLFKVQSSPTLEKEKEGIRTYLFGTNLTSDSEPTSHDILPPPRGVSAPRIDRETKASQDQLREEAQEETSGPKQSPEDQQQQRGWSQSLDSIVPAHERIIEAVKASRRSVSKSVDSVQRPERKKRRSKLLSQKLSVEQSTLENKNEIEPPSSVPSAIKTLPTQSSSIGPLSSEPYLEPLRDNTVIVAPTRENKTSSQRESVSPQREDLSRRDPSPPRRRSKSTVSRSTGHLTHEEEEDQPSWIRLAKERRSLRSPRPVEQVSDRASTASREPEWVTRARKRLESMNVCLTSTTDYSSVSSNITESSSAWSRGGLDALEDLREESYRIGEELTEQAAAKVDENLNLPKNTNMLEYHSDRTRDPSSERPRVSFDPSAKPSEVVAPPRRSRSKKPQKDEIRFGDLKHDWGGVQNAPVKNGNGKSRETRFGEVTVQETTEKQMATTKVREMRFGDNPSPPPTETTKKEPPPPPKTVNGGKKPAMRFGDSPLNLFPEQAPTPRSSSKFESIPGPDPTTMTAEQLNQNVEEYDFPIPTGKEDATELMKFLEESIRKREAIPEVIMKPDDVPKPKSILKRRSVENVMLETKESGDWPQKVEHRKSASFDWDSVEPQNSGYLLEKESKSDSCEESVPSKITGSEAKEQTPKIKESEANVTNTVKTQRLKFSGESSPKDSPSLPPSPSPSFNASLPISKVETQTCSLSTSVADDVQQSDREDDNITHETSRDSSETPDLEVTQTREANQVSAAAAGANSNVFIANNTEPTSTITTTTTTTTDIQTPLISSPMLHCLAYSSPNHLNPVITTVLGPATDKDPQAFTSEPDGVPEGDSSAAFVTSCAMDVPEATKSPPKIFTFTFNVDQHSPPETSLTNLTEEEYINQKNRKQKSQGKGNLTTFTLTTNPDDVKLENKERIIKITKDSDHSDPDTDGSASEPPLKEDEEVSRKTSDGFFSTLMSEKEVEARKQSSKVEARKDSSTSNAENFREVTVEIADKDNNRKDSKEQKVKKNSLIEWEAIQRQRLEEDEKNRLNKNFSMKPVSTKIKELVKMHGSFITRQLSKDKKVEERGLNGHTEVPNSNVSHSEAKNIPSSEEITSPYIVKKMLAPLKSWSHLDCSDLSKFERIDDYSDMRNNSASARSKGPKKSQSDIFNVTGDDIQKLDVVNAGSHPTRRSGVIHWTSPLSLNAKEDPAVAPERKISPPLHIQANGLNPSESSSTSLSKAGDSPKTPSLRSKFANWTSRMSRTSDPSPVILEPTGKEEPPPAFERKEEKRSSIKDPKSRKEWLDKMLNTISPDHITLIDRLDEERRRSLESPRDTTKSPENHVFSSNEHCLSNGTAVEPTTNVVGDSPVFKRTSSLRDDERVSKSSQMSYLRRSSGPSDNRPEYHDRYDWTDSKDTSRDISKSGTPASSINDISQWERDMRGPVSLSSILSDSRPGSRSSSRLGSRSSSPMTTPRATPERVIPKELAKVGSKLQLISENSLDTKIKKSSHQKENIVPTQTDSLKPTSQIKSTMPVETSQFSPSPSRSSFRSRLHSRESTPPREQEKLKEESGSSWRPSSYKPFNFGKPLLTMKTMTSGADSKKASMLKSPLFQNSPSSRARQTEKVHTSPEASSPKSFVFSDIQDSTVESKTKSFHFEPFSMRYARERGPLRSQTTPDRESTPDRDRPVSLSSILSRDDSSRRSSDAYQFKPSLSFSEELNDITHQYQKEMGDSDPPQEQKTDDPSSRKLSNMSVGENEVFGEEEKDKGKQEKPQKKPVKEKTSERTRSTSDTRGGSPLRPPPPKKQNSAPPCRKCSRESHKGSTPPRTLRGESPTNSRRESCSSKGPSGKPVTRRGSTKRGRLDDKLAVTTVVKKERINSENDDPIVKSETVVHDPDGQGWIKTKTTVRKTRLGDGTTEKMTKVVRTDSGRSDRSFKTNASRQLEAWAAGAGTEGKLVKKEGQRFRSETEEEVVGGQKVTKTKGRRVIRRGSRRFSGGGELLSETKEMSSAGKSDNKFKGTKNSSSRKPEGGDRTIQTITTTEDDGLNRKLKSSTDGERYMTQSVLTRDGRHTFTTEGVDNKTTNSVEVIGGAAWAGERQVRGKTGQRVVVQRSHGADGRAATLVTKAVTKSTYIVNGTNGGHLRVWSCGTSERIVSLPPVFKTHQHPSHLEVQPQVDTVSVPGPEFLKKQKIKKNYHCKPVTQRVPR
ncbi:uncharacterized protein LOC143032120 isoform X4 [Oratosquilla oratoria]|uniref:uncharacterized protein LOC143032120 isoform X4 n=1 Tax=Oratosquilla oratoria TaxID=337810 RepID=UPI003F75AD14